MNKRTTHRRGAMEKRRRDKINNSLIELKSLVPLALMKESSEKLEKAEILSLTVDYLKSIKEGKCDLNDVDFREMGYRECMLDISDYLLNDGEHLELNDTSFRARLMSHLKCSTPNRNILNDMFLLAIANSFGQVNQH